MRFTRGQHNPSDHNSSGALTWLWLLPPHQTAPPQAAIPTCTHPSEPIRCCTLLPAPPLAAPRPPRQTHARSQTGLIPQPTPSPIPTSPPKVHRTHPTTRPVTNRTAGSSTGVVAASASACGGCATDMDGWGTSTSRISSYRRRPGNGRRARGGYYRHPVGGDADTGSSDPKDGRSVTDRGSGRKLAEWRGAARRSSAPGSPPRCSAAASATQVRDSLSQQDARQRRQHGGVRRGGHSTTPPHEIPSTVPIPPVT